MISSLTYANSIINNGLSLAHAMGVESAVQLDWTFLEGARYKYKGTVDTTYVDATSQRFHETYTSIYLLSPEYHNFRFAISKRPSLADSIYDVWDNEAINKYTKNYFYENSFLTPQISYKFSDQFTASVGMNFVKSSVYSDATTIAMNGEGRGESYTFSLTYRPIRPLFLTANYTTKTKITIKGSAESVLGNSNGSVYFALPRKQELAATLFLSPTSYVYASYLKKFYTIFDTLDINFDNPTIESVYGTSKPRYWNNKHYYKLGYGNKFDSLLTQLLIGKIEGGYNERNAALSMPVMDQYFVSANAFYSLAKDFDLGFRYTKVFFEHRNISSATLNGSLENTNTDIYTLSIRKRF